MFNKPFKIQLKFNSIFKYLDIEVLNKTNLGLFQFLTWVNFKLIANNRVQAACVDTRIECIERVHVYQLKAIQTEQESKRTVVVFVAFQQANLFIEFLLQLELFIQIDQEGVQVGEAARRMSHSRVRGRLRCSGYRKTIRNQKQKTARVVAVQPSYQLIILKWLS